MVPALTGVSLTQSKLFQLPLLKIQHPPMSPAFPHAPFAGHVCFLSLMDPPMPANSQTHTHTTPIHTSPTPYTLITPLTPKPPQHPHTIPYTHAYNPYTHTAFPRCYTLNAPHTRIILPHTHPSYIPSIHTTVPTHSPYTHTQHSHGATPSTHHTHVKFSPTHTI